MKQECNVSALLFMQFLESLTELASATSARQNSQVLIGQVLNSTRKSSAELSRYCGTADWGSVDEEDD